MPVVELPGQTSQSKAPRLALNSFPGRLASARFSWNTMPYLDGVMVDRACSFLPHARSLEVMIQGKYWSVDTFHAQGKSCECNPLYQKRPSRRFKLTNSSAAEQVFGGFRSHARALHGCTPSRHALLRTRISADFMMQLWSPLTSTLGLLCKKGKSSRPCSCAKKPASKILKRPSSKH